MFLEIFNFLAYGLITLISIFIGLMIGIEQVKWQARELSRRNNKPASNKRKKNG